jgi:hypothetical protein
MKNQQLTRSIALCVVAVALWFAPWWMGGQVLAPLDVLHEMMEPWRDGNQEITAKNHIVSDSVDQYLVYRMLAEEGFRNEGRVGWSSLTYGGTAQYANTMALYQDWTMQLHRWFDFWTAWHLGLMGQMMIAACGMLLWLRGRGVGDGWAVCGALLFAFNSQFITWINHRWALGAFCWVPWIFWAIDARKRGGCPAVWLVPGFIALAFLGGTLQHAALVVLAVMALWLEEALDANNRPAHAQARLLGRYAAWGLTALALAAPMWLPCVDSFLTTDNLGLHTGLHGKAAGVYPAGPLQPLFNLAAYPGQVFPSVFGRSDSLDLLKVFKSELFYVVYFGSLPVLIGYLSLWARRVPVVARILIAAGLLLPLTPLVRPLYQRLFLLFIIGGILAFTHWMRHAPEASRRLVVRRAGIATIVAASAWLLASVAMHLRRDWLDGVVHARLGGMGAGSSFGYFEAWMDGRIARFIDDLFIWSPHHLWPLLLWVAVLAGLALTLGRGRMRPAGRLLAGVAVVLEVLLFASKWVVWSDPEKHPLFPQTAESRLLQEHVGRDGRVTTMIHPAHHMARTPFVPNTLAAYGIASIQGYDSILPDGMNMAAMGTFDPVVLGPLGVSHLMTWSGNSDVPDGWQLVANTATMALYENPHRVPRYAGFPAGGGPGIPLVETTGHENRRAIVIPPGLSAVRIAENHAQGWQYRLDGGTWTDVARAGDASMMVPVTGVSASLVELRYQPPLRRIGFAIAGAGAIAWLGIAAVAGMKAGKST